MSAVRLATVLEGHTARVRSLAFSPDGAVLVSAADDGTTRVWDLERGQSAILPTKHRDYLSIAVSRRGRFVVTAGPPYPVRLWDVATASTHGTHRGPGAGLVAVAAFHDRDAFAIALDQRVLSWDAPSGAVDALGLERFPHDDLYFVRALGVSPDGRTLATGSVSMSWDRGAWTPFESVRLWDTPSGILKATYGPTPPMDELTFSPNGMLLAAASREGEDTVQVWQTNTQRPLAVMSGRDLAGTVDALAFSPNGLLLTIAVREGHGPAAAVLFDLTAGVATARLAVTSLATRLALSPDGTRLASAGEPGEHSVRVWTLT